jgi:hypothetical protein
MFARMTFAAALAALVAFPISAQPPKKGDATADLLAKLRLPCDLKAGEASLDVFAEEISKVSGIPILVNENALNGVGAMGEVALRADAGPTVKIPKVKGLPVGVVLRHCLSQVQATYLVRKSYIEIVSVAAAIRESKNDLPDDLADGLTMRAPLVSAIFKEKPLNEAVAELADEFEVTVVVSPQAGDNKTGFVSARLLNVPADDALELLAAQADLRVVRQGKAFLITSPDHANQIFEEKTAREQRQIELQRMRNTPFGLGGLGGGQPIPDKDK